MLFINFYPGCNSKYIGKTEQNVYDWKDITNPSWITAP